MKMDTTTWVLLLVLLFLLLQKRASAATQSGAAGSLLRPGSTTNSKPSIWQQFFGTPPQTPAKGGISAGPGAGGGTTSRPAPTSTAPPRQTGWRPPSRAPLNLLPSAPLTALIPSIPPPVYDLPERNYPGQMPTIPSDTSGVYILPEEPPAYENVSHTYDYGDPGALNAYGFLDSVEANIPGTAFFDPTSFNPVDTQTIDTSNLGGIAYLPDQGADWGQNFFASGGGYNNYGGGGGGDNLQTTNANDFVDEFYDMSQE